MAVILFIIVGFTSTYALSAYIITTKFVSFIPTHGEVNLKQHCVMKYVSDLQ